jgi:hypothetical protein
MSPTGRPPTAGEVHRRIGRALDVLDIADIAAALDDPTPFQAACHHEADHAADHGLGARSASWRALAGCPAAAVRDVLAARGVVLFARDRRRRA